MIASLVRRARAGDAEAYTELVRRLQDAVFATAYQTVYDYEAARDIAQEAFVRAYESLHSLKDPAAFPGWIIRICRSLATSWLRRPERRWVGLEQVPAQHGDPAATVAARDLVARALATVPEPNRLAVSLLLVDGYTYQEVADFTGVSLSTVKGRIHRARRRIAQEVLTMVEDSLKQEAPDEQFTADTMRAALEKAREAHKQRQELVARAHAEEALEALSKADVSEQERRALRHEALALVAYATLFPDPRRFEQATREIVQLAEEAGDKLDFAQWLYSLAVHARNIPRAEQEDMVDRCLAIWREADEKEMIGLALFLRGWRRIEDGRFEEGFRTLGEARAAMQGLPYNCWHGCLDAADDFGTACGGRIDPSRRIKWGAVCWVLRLQGGRLAYLRGQGRTLGTHRARFADGFDLLSWVKWLPYTDPSVGFEEERDTFSCTGNPTHTRLWIETHSADVETPAGAFPGCLLMRATVTESPADTDTESRQREVNKIWLGERYCWLARGVGPVAYRAERADGIVEHAVLAKWECPEKVEEWVPLVVGTRWEYVSAEPPDDLEALVLRRVTHIADDGTVYLTKTIVGNRL